MLKHYMRSGIETAIFLGIFWLSSGTAVMGEDRRGGNRDDHREYSQKDSEEGNALENYKTEDKSDRAAGKKDSWERDMAESQEDNTDHDRGNSSAERHYYRDGKWYRHDTAGGEIYVSDIPVGAIAEVLPPEHTTIVIQDTPYYYDNVHYYKQLPGGGYVVVDAPSR
ncbi:MAG: hypothetical protein HQL28_03830 [Candidatus Omnitrophica bacterium]|nr:hypothetical protein [Candidatus Omnitrophota bacterium]